MGNEGGEALEEGERIEDEGAGAVAPGAAESPLDLAVLADLEAALGKGRAGDVANETFEAVGVLGLDAGGGVEREAVGFGGEGWGSGETLARRPQVGGVISETGDGAAGFGAEGGSVLDGGGVQEGEERGAGIVGGGLG